MKLLISLLMLSTPAMAQTMVVPNGAGGYNVYGGQKGPVLITPNGADGYNVYGPRVEHSQILSNGAGGFNIYSSPRVKDGDD